MPAPADLGAVLERLSRVEALLAEMRPFVVRNPHGVDPEKLYSVREIADLAGVTAQAVYVHLETGKLKAVPTGTIRARRVRGVDLLAWLGVRA